MANALAGAKLPVLPINLDAPMLVDIRTYEVLAGFVHQFTGAYGSGGCWAVFFSKSDAFWGRQLLEGTDGTYLTIDQWRSECDFASFMGDHKVEYEALSRTTEGWALEEALIGWFRCSAEIPARRGLGLSLPGEAAGGEVKGQVDTVASFRSAPTGSSVTLPSRGNDV